MQNLRRAHCVLEPAATVCSIWLSKADVSASICIVNCVPSFKNPADEQTSPPPEARKGTNVCKHKMTFNFKHDTLIASMSYMFPELEGATQTRPALKSVMTIKRMVPLLKSRVNETNSLYFFPLPGG